MRAAYEYEQEAEYEKSPLPPRKIVVRDKKPPLPRGSATFRDHDVVDGRIDVAAQRTLIRLRNNPATSADAVQMLRDIRGTEPLALDIALGGIYGDDLVIAAQIARLHNKFRWELVPPGRDAFAVQHNSEDLNDENIPDPFNNPFAATIFFRAHLRNDRQRLDQAIHSAWREFRSRALPGGGAGGAQVVEDERLGFVWVIGEGGALPPAIASALPRAPRGSSAEYAILAGPERQPVRNTLAAPFRFVCRLQIAFTNPFAPNSTIVGTGSGTLIGDRHILTAGHNLLFSFRRPNLPPSPRVRPFLIFASPGQNGQQQPFGSSVAVNTRFPPEWAAAENPNFDFGLITLAEPLGATRRPALGNRPLGFWGHPQLGGGTRIAVSRLNGLAGLGVNVAGYPADKCGDQPPTGSLTPQQILATCQIGRHATVQWESVGSVLHPAAPGIPRVVTYSNDTFGGHSGAPVWSSRAGLNLVAVHSGPFPFPVPPGGRPQANRGVRVTDPMLATLRGWLREDGVTPTF